MGVWGTMMASITRTNGRLHLTIRTQSFGMKVQLR